MTSLLTEIKIEGAQSYVKIFFKDGSFITEFHNYNQDNKTHTIHTVSHMSYRDAMVHAKSVRDIFLSSLKNKGNMNPLVDY